MLPEHHVPHRTVSNQDSECWPQLLIEWNSRTAAEHTAADHLLPALATANREERLDRWFFVRKHPHWRLRYLGSISMRTELAQLLNELHSSGDVDWWAHSFYEPEVLAFGGPAAMRTAHALFHHDSHYLLAYVARQNTIDPLRELGRRELGVLLISTLLRAAGQDWYEQGDVWHHVAVHRQAARSPGGERQRARMHRLMTADAARTDGPLAILQDWIHAFTTAGRELADHARYGRLERGLRAILAHHTMFVFNRLGLSAHEQLALAELATEVVMNEHSLPSAGAGDGDVAHGRSGSSERDHGTSELDVEDRSRRSDIQAVEPSDGEGASSHGRCGDVEVR